MHAIAGEFFYREMEARRKATGQRISRAPWTALAAMSLPALLIALLTLGIFGPFHVLIEWFR